MPSTYSSSLRLELQATGENANTWGTKTNNNLNLLQQAISGYRSLNISGGSSYVVSAADGVLDEARNAVLELTGTMTSAVSVIVPDVAKTYWVRCQASGANVTFRASAGTGVVLPRDLWVFLVNTGTTVVNALPPSAQLSAVQTFTDINTFSSIVNLTGTINVTGSVSVTDKAGFRAALNITSATQTSAGLVRLADTSAVLAGVDTERVATPAGVDATMSRIQQVSKSAAYEVSLGDAGRHILHPSADTTARIFTIPSNTTAAFPLGTAITFINQVSAGALTISITTDTLILSGDGSTGSRTLTAPGMATAIKVATTQWMIAGSGIS